MCLRPIYGSSLPEDSHFFQREVNAFEVGDRSRRVVRRRPGRGSSRAVYVAIIAQFQRTEPIRN